MAPIVYDAIVPAAGSSARFGRDKITSLLAEATVIEWALRPFLDDPDCRLVILMAGQNYDDLLRLFNGIDKVVVKRGGTDRSGTVRKGLEHVTSPHVVIHDGARPYLSPALLRRVVGALATSDAVVPVLQPVESVIEVEGNLLGYIDRSSLRMVQTPQGFVTSCLRDAFGKELPNGQKRAVYGDEGALYLAKLGPDRLALVDGDPHNRKITHASDLPPPL